jgi:hypothetical protein
VIGPVGLTKMGRRTRELGFAKPAGRATSISLAEGKANWVVAHGRRTQLRALKPLVPEQARLGEIEERKVAAQLISQGQRHFHTASCSAWLAGRS